MLLYYITDRTQLGGDEISRRHQLLAKIAQAADCGVDYIQLREKDLCARELEALARDAAAVIRERRRPGSLTPGLLINSRTDVALAVGADGVHLRSNDVLSSDVRAIWNKAANRHGRATIAVSCHSSAEVVSAAADGADFAVFAPVFEKKDAGEVPPAGLSALREACKHGLPVLALGGMTLANADLCLAAGAAGIAAIRLFQENDVAEVVAALRGMGEKQITRAHTERSE